MYGEAEHILGDFGIKNLSGITKIRYEKNRADEDLEHRLVQSLRRLQIPRCYGLLLHNDEALAEP